MKLRKRNNCLLLTLFKVIRKAFLVTPKPGSQEEYERRHNPVWPELQDVLRKHNVSYYFDLLDRSTNKLFA